MPALPRAVICNELRFMDKCFPLDVNGARTWSAAQERAEYRSVADARSVRYHLWSWNNRHACVISGGCLHRAAKVLNGLLTQT